VALAPGKSLPWFLEMEQTLERGQHYERPWEQEEAKSPNFPGSRLGSPCSSPNSPGGGRKGVMPGAMKMRASKFGMLISRESLHMEQYTPLRKLHITSRLLGTKPLSPTLRGGWIPQEKTIGTPRCYKVSMKRHHPPSH